VKLRLGARAACPTVLFAFNLYLCHELFAIEFLNNFQSNEGALATLAKFAMAHPRATWFPLWSIGLPIEHTYSPLLPALIAVAAALFHISPAAAMHQVVAMFFCLVPMTWFLVLRAWDLPLGRAFSAAALYSLASPVAMVSAHFRADLKYPTDSRRLWDVLYYGDIAHMAVLCLLPVALWVIGRSCRSGQARDLAGAAILSAATVLTDGLGMTALGFGCIALLLSFERSEILPGVTRLVLTATLTYALVCPFLTPELLGTIAKNAQTSGGDYRYSAAALAGWAGLAVLCGAVWIVGRRFSFAGRFALSFTAIVGGLMALYLAMGIAVVPLPARYGLEADVALSILAVELTLLLPVRLRWAIAIAAAIAAIPLAIRERAFDVTLMQPVRVEDTAEFQVAQWIDRNAGAMRTMVSGDAEFWFNYFSAKPQLSGSHEPFSPNFAQRVAVYTIYTGTNAGTKDAFYSVVWLKAFGAWAIHVPGPSSTEAIHPYTSPLKFEGVLPVLWRGKGDTIYGVPSPLRSIAHVIPREALVARPPIHGLDTGPTERYVAAIEAASTKPAGIEWSGPDHATVRAEFQPGQVLSVQECYYPGWIATVGGKPLTLRADGLGMIVVEPECSGPCVIELRFVGQPWHLVYRFASVVALILILVLVIAPRRRRLEGTA
jgi:hypothetical protein